MKFNVTIFYQTRNPSMHKVEATDAEEAAWVAHGSPDRAFVRYEPRQACHYVNGQPTQVSRSQQ